MEGLEFLGTIIVIGMLVHWFLRHDRAPDRPTAGLFAMREDDDPSPSAAGRAQSPANPSQTNRRGEPFSARNR